MSNVFTFGQRVGTRYSTHPLPWHPAEQFHCPQHPPCPFPPHSPSLVTTDLSAVFVVWPFPKCHGVGIAQAVAVSDWLLSSLWDVRLRGLRSLHGLGAPFSVEPNHSLLSGCATVCLSCDMESLTAEALGKDPTKAGPSWRREPQMSGCPGSGVGGLRGGERGLGAAGSSCCT